MSTGGGERERITVTVADGVADVRLDRAEKMNAVDPAMFSALVGIGERLGALPGLRAVVLSGEGRGFCAGLDFGSFSTMSSGHGDQLFGDIVARTHGVANAPQQAVLVWRQLPVPVIAAIHGVAFGAGFQIALAADIRLAEPAARFSIMETKWGLVPDMGGMVLMRELARDDVIRDLTYTGRVFSAEEARTFGFVTRIEAEPRLAALALAREIAARSPQAVRAAKRLCNLAADLAAEKVLLAESIEQKALIGSPDQIEAVTANVAGRAPVFADPAPVSPGRT